MYSKNIFLKIVAVLVYVSLSWSTASNADTLEKQVQELIRATGEDLNIGVYVENLDTKEVKLAIHPDRKFIPASNTKLFTAYAALDYLGKDFQFKTTILCDKNINKGKKSIDGNLYIKFSGDPTLSYAELESMIKALNISTIKGDVILDKTIFDDYTTSPGGFAWDDYPFCYAAPKSAIIINNNCSEAMMWPQKKESSIAELKLEESCALKVTNNVQTVRPRKETCPYKSKYLGDNHYELYGCMFNNEKPIRLNFAVPDNKLMAQRYIENILKTLNIHMNGQIKFAKASGKKVLHVHKSTKLETLLIPVMKDSMNLSSASLFNYMGYKHTGVQGSDEAGEEMMKVFLRKKGISQGVLLRDGSGESTYNLITPRSLVQLLHNAYASEKIRDIFIKALPVCNGEGTLKYRDVGNKHNKYIRAKTGNSSKVSSVSGYYLPEGNKARYVFAIMSNNHTLGYARIKQLEDQILRLVLEN